MEALKVSTDVAAEYPDYLRDESRMTGSADSISFPETEEQLLESLAYARERGLAVTTQGARTGITGGAVSPEGHIINLSRMKRVLGIRYDEDLQTYCIRVQPGVVLGDLIEMLAQKSFDTDGWSKASLAVLDRFKQDGAFKLGPDPTEWTASIGGMTACNASGAKSYFYGATRKHVTALRVVLADGDVVMLQRGRQKAEGRRFTVTTEKGGTVSGLLPSYDPPDVKTAAGYHAADDMDLIDLFIGSEGTLGIFPEIELRLVPVLPVLWGIVAFFPDEPSGLGFVHDVRGDNTSEPGPPTGLQPAAIEFYGHRALELLRSKVEEVPGFAGIPELPEAFHTGVYVEFQGESEDGVTDAVMAMSEIMVARGGDEDATWIASGSTEWERLREFRHAIPETVNALIDERRKKEPALMKLGTDMAVPNDKLDEVVRLYRDSLDRAGLEHVMFGHISANHIHVNILPRSMEDYARGKELYLAWADQVIAMGGTVSAEHGIGKIKVSFLEKMYGKKGIDEMRAVKRLFDPENRLNPGNLFG